MDDNNKEKKKKSFHGPAALHATGTYVAAMGGPVGWVIGGLMVGAGFLWGRDIEKENAEISKRSAK